MEKQLSFVSLDIFVIQPIPKKLLISGKKSTPPTTDSTNILLIYFKIHTFEICILKANFNWKVKYYEPNIKYQI